jgi:hypothetical protein
MRLLISVVLLFGLVSCSSTKTGDPASDALIAHMEKGSRVVGKDWDPKFEKDGFVNNEYVAIGNSTNKDINSFHQSLRIGAEAQATARLLKSAPTDFKKVVQRVINSLDGDEGSTEESQISITEVKSLTGMSSNFDDHQCVNTAHPTSALGWTFVKECRVIVRVKASELIKAYAYTLDRKYGVKKQSQISEMLRQEMLIPAPVSAQVANE